MSYEIRGEDMDRWERDHDYKIHWKCPQCEYSYDSERYLNESLNCPHCNCKTENCGESYLS